MPKHKSDAVSSPVAVRPLRNARLRAVSAIAPLLLSACAGDVVNLGENEAELSPPPGSVCQSSTTLEGSILVENQEQLDALEGCEIIAGDLEISAFPAANFRSLYALLRVEGRFLLGVYTTPPMTRLSQEELIAQFNLWGERMGDWLESLEGLERLEAVDTLSIMAPISRLQPLSGLRYITSGQLTVASEDLESLAGLEAVRGISSLYVQGTRLRDISALHLPEAMSSLRVVAPIDALNASEMKSLSTLQLSTTALENLDAFENLERVDYMSAQSNANLQNMDGLNKVNAIDRLFVLDNDALERLGEFASLVSLNSIHIEDNDNLSELSSFPSTIEVRIDVRTFLPIPGNSLQRVHIRNNGSLRHLALPDAWKGADSIEIMNNAALEDIDFGGLVSAGTMSIMRNETLAHVSLGALSTVATLQVTGNPLLPPTDFDGVRTFESVFTDNASAP